MRDKLRNKRIIYFNNFYLKNAIVFIVNIKNKYLFKKKYRIKVYLTRQKYSVFKVNEYLV